MKRILTGILVTMLAFSASAGFASEIPFSDIENAEVASAVEALYAMNDVSGVSANAYAPNKVLTNAEGVQLIVNILDLSLAHITFIKAPEATDYFQNADNDAWYADGLIIAAANGLELPQNLVPNAEMTREAFTYYMINAFETKYELPQIKLIPIDFLDSESVNVLYSGAIQRALSYGVISLDADGNINPAKPMLRGEAAVMLKAMYDYAENKKTTEDFSGALNVLDNDTGITLAFEVFNNTGEDQVVTFGSGQSFDYSVYDSAGQEVYRWSHNKAFTMALRDVAFSVDEPMHFEDTWKWTDNDGTPLTAGRYEIAFHVSFYWNETLYTAHDTVYIDHE